ncbi:MAG: flagellar hook assembly protein FlgD [Parvularculaceae bacterium]|nr:flagellar hook assembly protein FlgD [Parvularculaceae bacterium]
MEISALQSSPSSPSTGALSQLTGNLDSFLTLLTTQLRNQDPLDPLDTEKFTSQLVQFASVEQTIQTNKHLETLIGLQAAADRDGALAMIGKTIVADSDKAAIRGGGASWTYTLPDGATSASLVIVDDKGRPVASFAGDPRAGAHHFNWNGELADGARAPDGVYQLLVQAKDGTGAKAPFEIQSHSRVTGVGFSASGPALETDAGAIALSDVSRVIAGEEK